MVTALLGFSIGPALGGVVAETYGYHMPFYITAVGMSLGSQSVGQHHFVLVLDRPKITFLMVCDNENAVPASHDNDAGRKWTVEDLISYIPDGSIIFQSHPSRH